VTGRALWLGQSFRMRQFFVLGVALRAAHWSMSRLRDLLPSVVTSRTIYLRPGRRHPPQQDDRDEQPGA
jgi:hypothetical protein